MKLAVTGASGYIASAIIPWLYDQGHEVLLFNRTDYSDFLTKIGGCDAILHTAVLNNDETASLEQFRAVNVHLAEWLAVQARDANVPLFINFTTLQAARPFRSHYAQSKFEGEQALNAVTGIRTVHLHLAAVHTDGEFRGKLAALNPFPPLVKSGLFSMLAALRPTTHINRVKTAITETLNGGDSQIVTDGQTKNPFYTILNRLMDYGFALAVLVFLWWLLIGVWIAIGRSAIFTQPRVGRHGKVFTCYKFRTMEQGTAQVATHEASASSITKLGHFLRRTKIDELPQVVNILLGQMSLIGPRPCLPSQQELIDWRQKLGVLEARPGITGLAQVNGVDMSDPEKLARLDAAYIARRSILLDLKILLATVRGKGSQDYVAKP